MRAIAFEQYGEPRDVLTIAERTVAEPGPGEVQVALILSPIHHHDLEIVRGLYGYKPALPAVPGTEALVRITAVGPGVTHLSVGQRGALNRDQHVWAERFVCPAWRVVAVPDSVPDETAAQVLLMPWSARALVDHLDLRAGDWLMINAANGAVGKLVNLFARRRGLHVLNLVRRPAAVAAMHELGYDPALDTENPDWMDQVEAATSGALITRAIDQLGGRAADEELALLAPGGRITSFGQLTGEPMSINSGTLIFKNAVVDGFWVNKSNAKLGRTRIIQMAEELIELAARGGLRSDFEAVYPLEDVAEAVVAAEASGRNAKIALCAQPS
ncbi:zinc-binding dehydrogenase [Nocardia sp. 004]|uniref:zinc-binding dehydrogenase n=1 Tax=Nocardia sp. 004 TaxID=3385978 RepID=UPI00399EFB6D